MASKKVALVTGITGQDGAYLAELLLAKGYEVHGIIRRSSSFNTARLDEIYQDPHEPDYRLSLVYGDLNDASSLNRILRTVKPDEIYNLGAQSHVRVSFDVPEYTAEVTGIGTVRLLEAVRESGIQPRFYQASTSELFGKVHETPQTEKTPFYPRSPYGAAKLYAYWITVNYREAYGMFACNGILFNHESPVRGETFVTRKITRALARIAIGLQDCLYIGNLGAKRDWGHAKDFVRAQWLMLQLPSPEDFVIATGVQRSVREFVNAVAAEYGIQLDWQGRGKDETARIAKSTNKRFTSLKPGQTVVRVDPHYFRPSEVDSLLGDASKAKAKLGWTPEISFKDLVAEMAREDLALAERDLLARTLGHKTFDYHDERA